MSSLPTRAFREHTDLDQLRRQAKELHAAYLAGDGSASAEVNTHYRVVAPGAFALTDAQLVLARAYGFPSWPKLKAYVEGAAARRLVEAVRTGDYPRADTMLRTRPELVNFDMGEDEHRAIHYAVMMRHPELTRLLMRHGADARKGVYPHRDATDAFTLATDRGYSEIVAILEEEEDRRRAAKAGSTAPAIPDRLLQPSAWSDGSALDLLREQPGLAESANASGWTPLHAAAATLHEEGVRWLLDHGADPNWEAGNGWTPLDLAASGKYWRSGADQYPDVARALLEGGAELGPLGAVALNERDWIRGLHAKGELNSATVRNIFKDCDGLLSIAVRHGQAAMLELLLELGLDPDEKMRVADMDELIYTLGHPLHLCVQLGRLDLARILLAAGANPNAEVYASGTPHYKAYKDNCPEFIALFEKYGGFLDAVSAGYSCQTEAARRLLAQEDAGALPAGAVPSGKSVAEELLWSACGGGDPEIVRMALPRIPWEPGDKRWHWPMWQAFTSDGGPAVALECLTLILERADPNLAHEGRTLLHTIMARGGPEHVPHATLFLDRGIRLDIRDEMLRSTALGWACRWGRRHFVDLLLRYGADPLERDAEPWARPLAWAQKRGHEAIAADLRRRITS